MNRIRLYPLVLVLALSGCNRSPSPKSDADNAEPPRVRLVHPKHQTLVREIDYPARVRAFAEATLHARVPGNILSIPVDIGTWVKGPKPGTPAPGPDEPVTDENSGQVLAQLAVPELEEEVELKKRLVAQADSEITQAREAVKVAEARVTEVKAGEARVDADLKRWQAQLKSLETGTGTLAKQELEEVRFQVQSAEAAKVEQAAKVVSAEAAKKKAEADVGAAQAKRAAAEADRRKAIDMLRYATIRAPFDGVVTRRIADPGHYRQPGASGPRGEPIVVVTCTDPVRIVVDVKETDAVWIADRAPVKVRVPALGNAEFDAIVTRSSWGLDARARTLEVFIDMPNSDGRLRTEMYATALISVTHPNTQALPASAVAGQGDSAYAMRVVDGKAVRTPVKVGVSGGGLVEVLKKQTKPGVWDDVTEDDEFIADKIATLTDGTKVVVAEK